MNRYKWIIADENGFVDGPFHSYEAAQIAVMDYPANYFIDFL
jgi:hypothetical protein